MRRAAALAGIVALLGGVVAAAVLLVLGPRYRDRQIADLARAAVGCTTPLVFSQAGEYWVYEEIAASVPDTVAGCTPAPSDGAFRFELVGDPVPTVERDPGTVRYDGEPGTGRSLARVSVAAPGTYQLTVHGADGASVAAVGPDPGAIEDTYRRLALGLGIGGVVLGLALLATAARRGRPDTPPAGAPAPVDGPAPWPAPSTPPVGPAAAGVTGSGEAP